MALFGFSGYIIASFAFFVFILLLLAARNKTITGRLVLLASLSTMISFGVGAWQIQQHFSLLIVLAFETLKLLCWSLLVIATRENISQVSLLFKNRSSRQFIIFWLLSSIVCWFTIFNVSGGSKYIFLFLLSFNLWALVQLEQLFRNTEAKYRWSLAPLVIGLGATFVFDFVLFAQASMLNTLNFDLWYTRAVIATVSMPFLLISTRRMKDWSVNVFISRDVVFYSSMLMFAGLYLLLMAFAGYFINFIGGEWGSQFSLIFIVLGSIVLAALLITEKLRRQVKVFIAKHFFANKFDYRVEWLKLIDQLEHSDSQDYYKTALKIICGSLEIAHGAIVKRKASGSFEELYSEGVNLNASVFTQLKQVDSYCKIKPWIIDIREYNSIENSYQGLDIDSHIFVDCDISIIVPIVSSEQVFGFFLLSSPLENKRLLNWEDRDLLNAISKQLNHYLALNEANVKLSHAKQFDAFNRMSAFLVHDLKNVQAQLSLITANAEKHRDNPDFVDDVFETVQSATIRLDKMLTQLRNKQVLEKKSKRINIKTLIEKVVQQRNVDNPKVTIEPFEEDDIYLMAEEETLTAVLNHLIQNGQEATNHQGWVSIKASYFNQSVNIAISDNGCGMSEQFIKERLFKPFDTTKGNAGMGIGVFEAKQFIDGMGGSIQVTSFEGKGTTFILSLPDNN